MADSRRIRKSACPSAVTTQRRGSRRGRVSEAKTIALLHFTIDYASQFAPHCSLSLALCRRPVKALSVHLTTAPMNARLSLKSRSQYNFLAGRARCRMRRSLEWRCTACTKCMSEILPDQGDSAEQQERDEKERQELVAKIEFKAGTRSYN